MKTIGRKIVAKDIKNKNPLIWQKTTNPPLEHFCQYGKTLGYKHIVFCFSKNKKIQKIKDVQIAIVCKDKTDLKDQNIHFTLLGYSCRVAKL